VCFVVRGVIVSRKLFWCHVLVVFQAYPFPERAESSAAVWTVRTNHEKFGHGDVSISFSIISYQTYTSQDIHKLILTITTSWKRCKSVYVYPNTLKTTDCIWNNLTFKLHVWRRTTPTILAIKWLLFAFIVFCESATQLLCHSILSLNFIIFFYNGLSALYLLYFNFIWFI
jgi:hypothetical protein